MDFIENIRVSQERAEAGLGAKVDRAPAIFGAWKILRVGVAENPPAECDEPLRAGFLMNGCRYLFGGGHGMSFLWRCTSFKNSVRRTAYKI